VESVAEVPEVKTMDDKVELEQIPEAVVETQPAEEVIEEAPEDVSSPVQEDVDRSQR